MSSLLWTLVSKDLDLQLSRWEPIAVGRPSLQRLAIAGACFGVGFTPITALAISILGLCMLPQSTLFIVLPVMAVAPLFGLACPRLGRLALTGFAFGLVAVFVYDCLTRFPLIYLGILGDFIPNIGGWLVGSNDPDPVVGYLWRYLGNGGGMGMAFAAAYVLVRPPIEVRRAGVLFGLFVWGCLMVTLRVSPRGEELLFQLTPVNFAASLAGHIVYGGVLGWLMFLREKLGVGLVVVGPGPGWRISRVAGPGAPQRAMPTLALAEQLMEEPTPRVS